MAQLQTEWFKVTLKLLLKIGQPFALDISDEMQRQMQFLGPYPRCSGGPAPHVLKLRYGRAYFGPRS